MGNRLLATAAALYVLSGVPGCATGILWGCKRPEVTAYSLNPCEVDHWGKPRETGIPFYLPKPLLIIAKNFRNIEEAKVGLTDTAPIPVGFDDQSKFADLNARTNFNGLQGEATTSTAVGPSTVATNTGSAPASGPRLHSTGAPVTPGAAPADGLAPATFYTYHIVFVPDLTQKYGLKIRGGPGEIRAAMNLVNGWQFTGIGPFYMKDSATAQNILAGGIATRLGGQAAADVLNASANLAKAGGLQGGMLGADDPTVLSASKTISELRQGLVPMTLPNFAEIHVYEASLTPAGQMVWSEIAGLSFNRDYLGAERTDKVYAPKATPAPGGGLQGGLLGGPAVPPPGGAMPESVARAAVAGVFGLPPDTRSLAVVPGGLQAGTLGAVPTGGVNQIQVDCGDSGGKATKEFNLFRFGWGKKETPRPTIQHRTLAGEAGGLAAMPAPEGVPRVPTPGGGGMQGGRLEGPSPTPAIINQPIFNNPTPAAPVIKSETPGINSGTLGTP